jgi:glycerol-3-phosphate acyltransferase PlsY
MALRIVLAVLAGYFLGNLNGAFIMYRLLTHEDIRKSGSGNAGLTNFMRNFGPSKGIWVLVIDIAKAVLACLLGKLLLAPLAMGQLGLMIGALAVSIGHDFPVLLGFHGGKGIVCGFAVALCVDWRCALIIVVIFAISLAITRYVSLSSILGALGFCVSFLVLHWHEPIVAAFGVVIGLLAIFMHRANIKRLLSGTEKKATFSKFKKQK